ncbi:MAG: protein kinase [Planctomycetes bacterium]|nr:protein kinase [Planctomycetota bacterium]
MHDSEVIQIAVQEGLLSPGEVDRVRREITSHGANDLMPALLGAGLLRNTDIDRIRRDRGSTATRIPGELVATTHTRLIPDEVRDATSDPRSAFGRYTLLEKIGSGGMGTIWKAWDNTLGRWAAIKMLHEEHAVHDDHRERFLREARAAARLAHPNIVQVYEVGVQANVVFIALEFVPGETLRMRIAHRATGPEMRRRIDLVRQSAEGLGSAHASGITHRDMKPENVLVVPTPKGGQAKVVDFGLAVDKTAVTRLTVAGDVFGTPAYMAPEQALGLQEIVGPPADVFACGCILYEIVTGKLPFEADQAAASVYNTIHSDPPPLRKLAPKVHPDLETIVSKCLEKEPQRRYADAKELADDLGRYMSGEPISARPIGFLGRWKRRVRRNPALAAALAAAVLLPAALLGIFAWEARIRSDNIERSLEQAAQLEEQAALKPSLYQKVQALYESVLRDDENNERAIAGLSRSVRAVQSADEHEVSTTSSAVAVIGMKQAAEAKAAMRTAGRLGEAAARCDALVEGFPEMELAWLTRAELRRRLGLAGAAIADLDTARDRWVEGPVSRHLRIMCLLDLGRTESAAALVNSTPADPEGAIELAAVRLAQGRRDEARGALAKVPAPTAESRWVEGCLNARSGGWSSGRSDFEAALRLDPGFTPASLALVLAVREDGGLALGLKAARDLAEDIPAHAIARLIHAQLLSEAGDFTRAAREASRAARLLPLQPLKSLSGNLRLAAGDGGGVAELMESGQP